MASLKIWRREMIWVGVALFLALPQVAGANLILNGGFEAPVVYPAWWVSYGPAYYPPPEEFKWAVGVWGADQVGAYWNGASNMAGDQSVDIDYDTTLSQGFATASGQQYGLSFYYSHNCAGGGALGYVRVMGAGPTPLLSASLNHNTPNGPTDMKFTLYTGSFVADSATTALIFEGDAANGVTGFVVDAVEVNPVPLPATVALWGSGLLGLILWGRRG